MKLSDIVEDILNKIGITDADAIEHVFDTHRINSNIRIHDLFLRLLGELQNTSYKFSIIEFNVEQVKLHITAIDINDNLCDVLISFTNVSKTSMRMSTLITGYYWTDKTGTNILVPDISLLNTLKSLEGVA